MLDETKPSFRRSKEEELVEQNFRDTYRRDSSEKFIVTIPLKKSWKDIGTTELIAKQSFFCLGKKNWKEMLN